MSGTLSYFPVYGKGEALRWLLTHAKVDFVDEMITQDAWPERKVKDFNGASLPAWKFAGSDKIYGQSASILRMLGLKYGYLPTDPEEYHTVDTVMEAIVDYNDTKVLRALFGASDPTEEQIKTAVDAQHKFFVFLETLLAKHGKDFAAGEKITIADFAAGSFIHNYCLNKTKKFAAFTDALHADFLTFPYVTKYGNMMGELFKERLATRGPAPI